MDIFINQLKIRLSESNPDKELIDRILPEEGKEKKFQPKIIDDNGNVTEYSYIEEIVYHLCFGNLNSIKKIAETHGISNKNITQIVEITFDFVSWKKIPEAEYFIVDSYLLDEKRTTHGIFNYAKELINREDYQKAAEIINKYRGKMIPEQMVQFAARLFEQAMTFDKSEIQRDYTKAFKIWEIFLLKPNVTEPLAIAQYDYNIVKENYLTAANIAKVFQLDKSRMKRAAMMAFEVEFAKFRESIDNGEYFEKFHKKPNDPYLSAINILNDFSIMEERSVRDSFSKIYYGEASDAAYFNLRKIMSFPETKDFSFLKKSLISSNLISDFFLNDVIDIDRASACDNILGEIVRKLDDTIVSLEEAEIYYKLVLKLYNMYSSHKPVLQRISYRLFDFFVENDKIELAHKIFTDFKLDKRDILKPLMNRCLVLLKLMKIKEFTEFVETFSVVSELSKIREFMERIYLSFDKFVFNGLYEEAAVLCSMFKFPKDKVVSSSVSYCRELLLKGKDDEVIKIMHKFDLSQRHLRKAFYETYGIRIRTSWKEGHNFRNKFGISILEIGFFRWLFSEVWRASRISRWYLGEEIDIKKKDS